MQFVHSIRDEFHFVNRPFQNGLPGFPDKRILEMSVSDVTRQSTVRRHAMHREFRLGTTRKDITLCSQQYRLPSPNPSSAPVK